MSEHELIIELKKGSSRAFDRLYSQYARRMFCFCLQYIKSVEETEEIVQDIFLKLWMYRNSIRNEDTISNFLFTTAKNLIINRFRKQVHSRTYEEYIRNIKDTDSTSSNLEYDDFIKILNSEINKLPDTQKTVVRMNKLDGLEISEIISNTGLKEQTVYNALSNGLKVLRNRLKDILRLMPLLFLIK